MSRLGEPVLGKPTFVEIQARHLIALLSQLQPVSCRFLEGKDRCARVASWEREEEEPMEKHTVIGVDIAKAVFEVAVSKEAGRVADYRRLARRPFDSATTEGLHSWIR